MPRRTPADLFDAWEAELALVFEADPSAEEFWSYWHEREEVVERLARPVDSAFVDAGLARLTAIAEAQGYRRPSAALPGVPAPAPAGPVIAEPPIAMLDDAMPA
ncbi:hypothetical protein [Luteimonas sp. FCS-9]|uniref:hypothetical protein n=1 Tax=Luteimonas sp. FCS-9 TaxID=1547516 RepID=UPI00063EC735|nr:hypothetical protein [Luteimonas sp. FCS-9]KLJ01639.1 hypothetical protein WQ56_05000 [Luteimonas sp. FCS-9]